MQNVITTESLQALKKPNQTKRKTNKQKTTKKQTKSLEKSMQDSGNLSFNTSAPEVSRASSAYAGRKCYYSL